MAPPGEEEASGRVRAWRRTSKGAAPSLCPARCLSLQCSDLAKLLAGSFFRSKRTLCAVVLRLAYRGQHRSSGHSSVSSCPLLFPF